MSDVPPPPPGSPPPPPPPGSVPPPPPGFGAAPPPAYGAVPPGAVPFGAVPFGAAPPGGLRYAGWWRRVGAWILDGIIGWLFYVPALVALLTGPTEVVLRDGPSGLGFYEQPTGGTVAVAGLLGLVGFVVYTVIYCRMLGKGAPWGRRAAGYRVLDERTLQPIGTGRAVGRYFATILSALPCYLGLLWPLWDRENRTFHDMIVRTRAIRS